MMNSSALRAGTLRLLVAYYATLLVLTVVAFFPNGRVWGFNWWGYYPVWVPLALLVFGAVLPLLFIRRTQSAAATEPSGGRLFWLVGIPGSVLSVLGFFLLRNRTHFLGDGYSLIPLLAAEQPLIKSREIGESMVHLYVRDLVGGASDAAALLSYQLISIGAGALFAGSVLLTAALLFENTRNRLLFFFGMLTGGYMMLFFGYVENYSLFAFSIGIYCFIGVLAARRRVSKWWVIVPQVAAITLHIFGVVFLPSTVYLLLHDTGISRRISKLAFSVKLFAAFSIAGGLVLIFLHMLNQDVFFRMAFVPFVPHRFTLDGYTLFSAAHLADYLNLVFVLLPGLVVYFVATKWRGFRHSVRDSSLSFLAIAGACGLAAAFIFDPKLGMPRDWDLFAFAGIPLAVFVFGSLLHGKRPKSLATMLVISLNLLTLGPRCVSQILPAISIDHALNYKDLDRQKSRPLYVPLTKLVQQSGDTELYAQLTQEFFQRFPEFREAEALVAMMGKQPPQQILAYGRQILAHSPLTQGVWANMGLCFVTTGMLDSGIYYYEVADALNPGTPTLQSNLAAAYIRKGELDKASEYLDDAIDGDSTQSYFYYHKARIAQLRHDGTGYMRLLAKAASWPDAPMMYVTELCEEYMKVGNVTAARAVLDTALARGLDSAVAEALVATYPDLVH